MILSGSTIFVMLVVVAMTAVAVYGALLLEPRAKKRSAASYVRNRAALFAGTLREGMHALPAAAMEVRIGEGRAGLLAVYDDGATAFLQWGPRASGRIWTSKEPRMDEKQRRFRDAIATHGEGVAVVAGGPLPTIGTVVGHWRRADALVAGAPVPLDDVRNGRHALSGAWEVWGSLSRSWQWWLDYRDP
jgi:hypothetical protein